MRKLRLRYLNQPPPTQLLFRRARHYTQTWVVLGYFYVSFTKSAPNLETKIESVFITLKIIKKNITSPSVKYIFFKTVPGCRKSDFFKRLGASFLLNQEFCLKGSEMSFRKTLQASRILFASSKRGSDGNVEGGVHRILSRDQQHICWPDAEC